MNVHTLPDDEKLFTLIGPIYDTVLDSSLWPQVLCKACKFVGGSAAGLYAKDSVSKSTDIGYVYGIAPDYVRDYVEIYAKFDPSTTGHFFFDVGEVVGTADYVSYDEYLDTRFYKEWAQPQRWVDCVSAILEKSATSYGGLFMLMHERDGPLDELRRQRMKLLAPHLRRAALINKVIDLRKAEATTLADTFDGLAASVFLVDANTRIVQANVKGHALLAEGGILRSVSGRLVAADPKADQALREACAAAKDGDAGLGTQAIAILLSGDSDNRFVAHVLSLASGARRHRRADYAACAAVFVRKAELDKPTAPEMIAKLYGLTPSELRVLLAVFGTSGAADVAQTIGVSESTVRTHLRRLFEKTGTGRQAGLVKLVAGFSNPLLDDV